MNYEKELITWVRQNYWVTEYYWLSYNVIMFLNSNRGFGPSYWGHKMQQFLMPTLSCNTGK